MVDIQLVSNSQGATVFGVFLATAFSKAPQRNMLALKSDKSLIEKVSLFKKYDDDDLFAPAFATERLKLFINGISVVEFKK